MLNLKHKFYDAKRYNFLKNLTWDETRMTTIMKRSKYNMMLTVHNYIISCTPHWFPDFFSLPQVIIVSVILVAC